MNIVDFFECYRFRLYQFVEDTWIAYLDMTWGNPICFEVTEGLSAFPVTGYRDIPDIVGIDDDDICSYHNSRELDRATEELNKCKKTLSEIPTSRIHLQEKEYYENIIGNYREWFDKNNIALPEKEFNHSVDYRTLRLNRTEYFLTAKQAVIIDLLHQSFLNDTPEISQHTIITHLEGDEKETSYKRLKDFFKTDDHSKEIYKVFIRNGKRKDTFRLNI